MLNKTNDRVLDLVFYLLSTLFCIRLLLWLGSGELYFSRLDLNIENGAVEVPYRPMLRYGQHFYSADKDTHGVVLINYAGEWPYCMLSNER